MITKLTYRLLSAPLFWVGSVFMLAAIASNLPADDELSSDVKKTIVKVMREGTRIETAACECRIDGNRLVVRLGQGEDRTLIVLENLASQRILQAATDDPGDKNWMITGSVTEFQGRNFILLERISRASK